MDDRRIAAALFALLDRRAPDATVCPSDVARALAAERWRPLLPEVRRVAADLAVDGRVRVTRAGIEVVATAPGGPIRIGRAPPADT